MLKGALYNHNQQHNVLCCCLFTVIAILSVEIERSNPESPSPVCARLIPLYRPLGVHSIGLECHAKQGGLSKYIIEIKEEHSTVTTLKVLVLAFLDQQQVGKSTLINP